MFFSSFFPFFDALLRSQCFFCTNPHTSLQACIYCMFPQIGGGRKYDSVSVKVRDAGTKSPILKRLFFSHLIVRMSFYMHHSTHTGPQKWGLLDWKWAKNGIFGPKIICFCMPTCRPVLEDYPVISSALFL